MATAKSAKPATATSYTADQRRAIETAGVDMCVDAGAGSGKTRVLVDRMAHLLADEKLQLNEIVAITFTEMAAAEMKKRLRREFRARALMDDSRRMNFWRGLERQVSSARVTTIHSFCATLLRENALAIGIDPDFTVLADAESILFRKDVIKDALYGLLDDSYAPAVEAADELRVSPLLVAVEGLIQKSGSLRRATSGLPMDDPKALAARWAESVEQERQRRLMLLSKSHTIRQLIAALESFEGKCSDPADAREVFRIELIGVLRTFQKLSAAGQVERVLIELQQLKPGKPKTANWGAKKNYDAMKKAQDAVTKDLPQDLLRSEPDEAVEERAAELTCAIFQTYERVSEAYTEAKRQRAAMDFEDLLAAALDVLKNQEPVRQRVARGIRHLLIDEFQDTDGVQFAIAQHLAKGTARPAELFIVGDAKQSIYDFRGAEVEVFGEARKAAQERIALDINFRSLPGILEFVNDFFQRSALIETEGIAYDPLHANRDPRREPRVEFLLPEFDVEIPTARESRMAESDLIAARLDEMCSDPNTLVLDSATSEWRPAAHGDVAVLFRVSSDMALYEEALRRHGIPFNVAEGAGFYERQEISDIRNLLTALVDPWNEMALLGFLRSPIGALSDESLMELCAERGLADAFLSDLALDNAKQNERLQCARTLLSDLRKRADMPLHNLLRHLLIETGYEAILLAGRHGSQKVSNLRKLQDLAGAFSKIRPPRLPAFVRYLDDVASRALREGDARLPGEGESAVTLMTIHKAKGLEFPIVVLADTARDLKGRGNTEPVSFHRRLGLVASCTDSVGERQKPLLWESVERAAKDNKIAEDARILYVALTRARDWLLIAGAPAVAKQGSWLRSFDEVYGLSERRDGDALGGECWSGVVRRGAPPPQEPRTCGGARTAFSMEEMEKRISPIALQPSPGSSLSVTRLIRLMNGESVEQIGSEEEIASGGEGGGALLRGTMAHALFERWDFGTGDPPVNDVVTEFATGLRDRDGHGAYLAGLVERFAKTDLFGDLVRTASLEREVPFVLRIAGQSISGTVDAILNADVIIDYKTGRFHTDSHTGYERQIRLYALAMRQLTGRQAKSAILQYVDEADGRREVDVSEDALEDVLKLAESAVAALAAAI